MSKILFELRTAISPNGYSNEMVKNRIEQIFNGIKSVTKNIEILKKHNVEIYFLDNTIKDKKNLPKKISEELMKNNIKSYFLNKNFYGSRNKGLGEIEGLQFMKNKIKNSKWFIHFEPRQELQSFKFLNLFLNDKKNIFTRNVNFPHHFNTGLYVTESINVISFIKIFTEEAKQIMSNSKISLETIMYDFYCKNKIPFYEAEKMDLFWFDEHTKKVYHW